MILVALLWACSLAAQRYDPSRPDYPGRPDSTDRNSLWGRQAVQYDRQFSRIVKATEELGSRHTDEVWKKELNQLTSDAFFLQQRWRDWLTYHKQDYSSGPGPDRYYEGLKGDLELLQKATKTREQADAFKLVQNAALDLHAKAENCRNSDDGLGKDIRVCVRTFSDTNEVSGFEVWFAPIGLLNLNASHDRFYKLSSPTDQLDLAPGGYGFWTKKGKSKGEPVRLQIGGKGQKEIQLELLVPEISKASHGDTE